MLENISRTVQPLVLEENIRKITATSAGKECPEHYSHLCLQISFPVFIEVSNCMCNKMSILAWKRALARLVTTTSLPSFKP